MRSILVAPWGKPFRWGKTKYRFDEEVQESNSSLPVLIRKLNPSKTIIIVLDTLAETGGSYEELVKNVEALCWNFIKDKLKLNNSSIDILVSPGVGIFPNGVFKGRMEDYYSYVLFKLSSLLVENVENEKDVTIHLDLTHGVNFMPVLTYRALSEIAGILAISKSVNFNVYNSDPYSEEAKELSINIVEKTLVKPNPCRDLLSLNIRFLEPIDLTRDERKELYRNRLKNCRELSREEINAFLSSLVNGLPLILCTFYPDVSNLERCLRECEEIYKDYIRVENKGKLFVRRRICYSKDFVVLTKAYLSAKIINMQKCIEASLKQLHEIREKVFSKDKKLDVLISHELHTIESKIKNLSNKPSEWTLFTNILGEEEGEIDPRNFIAHAGLERNAIEIIYRCRDSLKEAVKVRYKQEKLEKIKKCASKGLETEMTSHEQN